MIFKITKKGTRRLYLNCFIKTPGSQQYLRRWWAPSPLDSRFLYGGKLWPVEHKDYRLTGDTRDATICIDMTAGCRNLISEWPHMGTHGACMTPRPLRTWRGQFATSCLAMNCSHWRNKPSNRLGICLSLPSMRHSLIHIKSCVAAAIWKWQ